MGFKCPLCREDYGNDPEGLVLHAAQSPGCLQMMQAMISQVKSDKARGFCCQLKGVSRRANDGRHLSSTQCG